MEQFKLLKYLRTEYPAMIVTPSENVLFVLENPDMKLEIGRIYQSRTEIESVRWMELGKDEAEISGILLESIREARFHIKTLQDSDIFIDPTKPYDINNEDQTIIRYGIISINIDKLVKDQLKLPELHDKEEKILDEYYRIKEFCED